MVSELVGAGSLVAEMLLDQAVCRSLLPTTSQCAYPISYSSEPCSAGAKNTSMYSIFAQSPRKAWDDKRWTTFEKLAPKARNEAKLSHVQNYMITKSRPWSHTSYQEVEKSSLQPYNFCEAFTALSLMVIPIWRRNSRYGKRALNQLALNSKWDRPNGWRSEMIKLDPNRFWIFLSNQMNHQCGWTNSHSAGNRDPQNGEIDQLPNSVSKYIFISDRMNHQCSCKTEVICHETELATICSNPIGCNFACQNT
jgi:hypothetical protein